MNAQTNSITIAQVKELLASGRIVFPYPRKGFVKIDGFIRKNASKAVFAFLKSLKN